MGLSWDMGDTALTIMNPAYGLYRLFGGQSATSHEGPVDPWGQVTLRDTQGAAYQEAGTRATAAEQRRQEALRALRAVRSAPSSSYAPIAVSVPSFSLGGRRRW